MVNPYFCYCLSFIIALITYGWGWSDLYPPLSTSLIVFLGLTIIVSFIFGFLTIKTKIIFFRKIEIANDLHLIAVTFFIYILWGIEFIYAGGVPLLKILMKQPFDYRVFGVPSLHVFVVTFSSFFTILLYQLYLSQKSRQRLILYGINLLAAILIYNRGMLLFNLSASAFLFLIYRRTISLRQLTLASVGIITLLYFFGMLGSLRVSHQARKKYSHEDFLQTGMASKSFRNSILPSEFFWSYIYISSPLANLQINVDRYSSRALTPVNIAEWINNEILPDFISKRVNAYWHLEREEEYRIPGPFNACTIYSRSYSYLGWAGMMMMLLFIILLPILFLRILPASSPFFLSGLAVLNTIFLFMVFDNTIRFTGLSFQLVYPVALHYGVTYFPYVHKFFSAKPQIRLNERTDSGA